MHFLFCKDLIGFKFNKIYYRNNTNSCISKYVYYENPYPSRCLCCRVLTIEPGRASEVGVPLGRVDQGNLASRRVITLRQARNTHRRHHRCFLSCSNQPRRHHCRSNTTANTRYRYHHLWVRRIAARRSRSSSYRGTWSSHPKRTSPSFS